MREMRLTEISQISYPILAELNFMERILGKLRDIRNLIFIKVENLETRSFPKPNRIDIID